MRVFAAFRLFSWLRIFVPIGAPTTSNVWRGVRVGLVFLAMLGGAVFFMASTYR